MANSLAMTALLIIIGLAGNSLLAADVGIVQGITLALFYSFSANARNLILNQITPISAQPLLVYRLILLLPLAVLAFWLARLSGVDAVLVIALLLRRAVEWLDEIFLSEMERTNRKIEVVRYIILQVFLLVFAVVWLLGDMPFPLLGIFSWALLPLWLSGKFYWRSLSFQMQIPADVLRKISPHIGSTAIIGITVYVFRILLIDIIGKSIAGDLFVAFAIGGVLGSVVANAFGPSVVFMQSKLNTRTLPNSLKALMAVFLLIGLLITLSSASLHFVNKSSLFWLAIGFSMMAAVPMVLAQLIRHRILQNHPDQDLFGSDVLMNVLLVALVPFAYYVFGLQAMAALYLLSSLLAWIFYKSYESHENGILAELDTKYKAIKLILAGLLIFPIFFQLGSGIFRDTALFFDANREITRLPIPFSILASFFVLISVGAFDRARASLVFAFCSFILMIAVILGNTSTGSIQQQSKFMLLAQFMLPMFALVAGQIFEGKHNINQYILEKSFFYILMLMVPLQIISSWLQGYWVLVPSVYVFSVYQHLHYVPIMFVATYMFIFYRLWQITSKTALLLLTLLMSVYVVMTASLFILIAFFLGLLIYSLYIGRFFDDRNIKFYFGLACLTSMAYWILSDYLSQSALPPVESTGYSIGIIEKAIIALEQKTIIWKHYLSVILNDTQTIFSGYVGEQALRSQFSSAHNYYLDFVYNFGLVGVLPLFILMGYTAYAVYKNSEAIMESPALFFPCLTLTFLLAVENSFYMGLRQPYSATLTFFIWGILLSRILGVSRIKEVR